MCREEKRAVKSNTWSAASWVAGRGHRGLDEEAAAAAPKDFGPRRYYLPKGAEGKIAFVDDEPFRFYAHSVYDPKARGGKGGWVSLTCAGEDDCPLCHVGERRIYCAAWTVVDRSEWVDKKGIEHKDELRLFVAKSDTISLLSRKSRKLRESGKADGLAGVCFTVYREDKKTSPNVGSEFEPVSKVPKLVSKFEPIDYESVLEPDMSRLRYFARRLEAGGAPDVVVSSRRPNADDVGSDDIPF